MPNRSESNRQRFCKLIFSNGHSNWWVSKFKAMENRLKVLSYSATNSTGATDKTNTLKFKEMFSFFIGLQTPKARLLCFKRDL